MDKLRGGGVSEGHGIFESVPFVDRRETRRSDWTAHDLTMQPLDKDGLFSVLKVLNQYCGSQPLTDEALRKAFEKWWSEFQTGLAQILSDQEPSKPRRNSEDMLEEILNIVRSIDKASNATILTGLPISTRDWTIARFVEDSAVPQSLKAKLMAEVAKSVPVLAPILERAFPQFADETLTLNFATYLDTPGFEFLTKPPYFDGLKKAASGLGFRVKVVKGSTSLDL